MEEYAFTVFRKILAITLILSLLWPDVARCMNEEKEDDLSTKGTILPLLPRENKSSQEGQNSSPPISRNENLKKEEKTEQLSLEKNSTIESTLATLPEAIENNTNNIPLPFETRNKDEEKEDQLENTTPSSSNTPIPNNFSALPSSRNIDDDKHLTNEKHEKDLCSSQTIQENIREVSNTLLIEEKKDEVNKSKETSSQSLEISENTEKPIENEKSNVSNIPSNSQNKDILQNPIEENEGINSKEDMDESIQIDNEKQDKEEENKNNEKDDLSIQPFPKEQNQDSSTSSLNEEEYEDFLILNTGKFGSQLELSLLQGNVQEDLLKETLAEKVLRLLKINPRSLTEEELKDLETLVKVEGSWRNHLVWSNLEILFHKALFALTTNKHAVNQKKQKKTCAPLWLHGGPLPLEDKAAIKRNLILKTAGNALEEGILEPLNALLLAGMGYQIYDLIKTHKFNWSLKFLANFYFNKTDTTSYIAMFNFLGDHPTLFGLLGVPLAFAAVKTAWNMLHTSEPTDEGVTKSIKAINDRSLKWDSRIFSVVSVLPLVSFFLMFHPTKSSIPSLATLILWEGKLPSETREKAFNAIVQLANTRRGISQLTAIESLVHITHGLNVRNLLLQPHDVEGLLKIKLHAFHVLKEVYQKLPYLSLNKLRTAVHLWEMGQSPSWRVSLIEPIVKALLSGLYVFGLYGIGTLLYDYIHCPAKYRERFSWIGGLQPWASDYSKECFDTQVKAFNLIPGQPASTLVGNITNNLLTKYHFSNNSYDLDLSNKSLNGSVIADIVEAFNRSNISLKSLNISFNNIETSSSMERILAALSPKIKNLDMSSVATIDKSFLPSAFLKLGHLTNLQSLNISGITLYPFDNSSTVMGQVLQNLFHLQELRLNWLFQCFNTDLTQFTQALKPSLRVLDLSYAYAMSNRESQVALGKALAQNLTLNQLYLSNAWMGCSAEGNAALGQGFKAQSNLQILDLSHNVFGRHSNMNLSAFLKFLPPSLTNLDISWNHITEISNINVLSQAVQKMSKLVSFNANPCGSQNAPNALGNSLTFLQALYDKKNLTFLDLTGNSFKNTTQMRSLLQTTPNLKELNLEGNQFTNGSLLAPVLSNLQKLTKLNLGGNNFVTKDRLAIWNATRSFLPKSPFFIDEDLNFTISYLQNLCPNTTNLNFAGLIPNNPTVLEPIMPIIVRHFTNLRELDLSNNPIGCTFTTNPVRGIEALIAYLPHLKDLQSFKMSNCGGYELQVPSAYFQNLSYIIGQLPNLRSIDLSFTWFIYADFLGKGLNKSHSLTSVNFEFTWQEQRVSSTLWQEGMELIQGLQTHPQLTNLNLGYNPIGGSSSVSDPNSTYALANAVSFWPHLQTLNLTACSIGYKDPKSSAYFLEKLAKLTTTANKEGRIFEVKLLDGISNIEWTQEAGVFQKLTEQSMIDNCARQVCTGKVLNTTQLKRKKHLPREERRIEPRKKSFDFQEVLVTEPLTSSSSRPFSFYQPVVNVLKPWFSVKSWTIWGDKALDSVANAILRYSKRVADDCPNLFPDRFVPSNAHLQEHNMVFANDSISYMQLSDQSPFPQIENFNHMQGLNHTFPSQVLPSSSQFLTLSK